MKSLLSERAAARALAAALALLCLSQSEAQTGARPGSAAACQGTVLTGTVRDSTQALIPGAMLTLDGTNTATAGPDGAFRFACVANGSHRLAVAAEGFSRTELSVATPHIPAIGVVLKPESVETSVNVSGDDSPATAGVNSSGPAQTISGDRLQSLADDPDDLLRELQQLAAAIGGNPANITIAVDGFQGASALPPKSSIEYIKINPDLFAAEYREPPFDGGRVEVYTKPGQKTYHGALFTTNGSPWENARDPFSTSKAAIGKQRYGFELTGPVRRTGSDFALALEHRSIDDFAVVDAVTLDPAGNTVGTIANVATPQRLWLGTARLDWQLGARNTFITSYSANVNSLQNLGVGGVSLAETGYDSGKYEHMLRASDITVLSPRLMHEARLSLRWDGRNDSPISTAPQVQVAGAFNGGGATRGPRQLHEFNVEFDDDAILTAKHHSMKFGTQLMLYHENQQLTTNFNGIYTFGGGAAPVLDATGNPIAGQTTTITGIEQYRRAQLGLAGGAATAFTNVAGTPAVQFNTLQNALFFEDDWEVGHGVHLSYGVRYYTQNHPTILNSATPRLGILWSPTKNGTWTVHAHAGTFAGQYDESVQAEILREDGTDRVTSTIYNPVYGNPFAGATPIHSIRTEAPGLGNLTWGGENVGGTRSLPGGWNLSLDYYLGRFWNYTRSNNINSPLNGQPYGPRPGAANLNVLQVQNSGQGRLNATFAGVEQHSIKRVQLFFGAVRIKLIDDTDDNEFFTPQSSTSTVGEFAQRTNQPTWNLFGNATFTLPKKLQLSADYNGSYGSHYNITTGFDNNGDGNFNDRPQYAAPGTSGAVATPYGLLTASGGTGVFPRNKAVLPGNIYLDMNLQRSFNLTRNPKAEHPQVLLLNIRSSNVLNHLNVTSVGGVLGSPLFGVPYAADNGRRVEAGARYSF